MASKKDSNVIIVPLCYQLVLSTDGSGTDSYVHLDVPELEDLGPYIKQITLHTDTQRPTTNFSWNLALWRGFDTKLWTGPELLLPAHITTNGYVVQPPHTDRSKYGMKCRIALAAKNTAGTAIEQATISAALAVELVMA